MFSKSCEYGIRSLIYIAGKSLKGERVKINEVSEELGIPAAFTAKIMGTLVRNNVLESHKGPTGGFFLSEKQLKETKLSKVVQAIDGDQLFHGCALGLPECNAAKPCPLHEDFVILRSNLKRMLDSAGINELANNYLDGSAFLSRKSS